MSKKFIIIYLIILAFEILAGEFGFAAGVYILKPAILSSLIVLVSLKGFAENRWFIIALFFSLMGDILLMINLPNLFLFGLGSFLITHLLYINIFRKKATLKTTVTGAFLVIVSVFFVLVLNNKIPEALTLPVIFYMLVITVMGITANSVKSINNSAYILGFGAILFIVSDSLIAYDKFVSPLPFRTLLVMSTYGIGQLLITKGYLSIFGNTNESSELQT